MAKTTTKPKTETAPASRAPAPGAIRWGARLYKQMLERDLAAVGHHLREGTLAKYLTERGTAADIAFNRMTLPGGIDAKAADKEVAETYIDIPPDTTPLDGAAAKELRPAIVEWEKGPGRPFVTPRD